jgi:hypothetical protein
MNARDTALALATRAASATFRPVPYKLIEIHTDHHGDEFVAPSAPKPYAGMRLDPWKRGDLVAIERRMTVTYNHTYSGKRLLSEAASSWHIGRRFTPPSAKRQTISIDTQNHYGIEPYPNKDKLFRIVLRYLVAAERLIGQEFDSREALETALGQ